MFTYQKSKTLNLLTIPMPGTETLTIMVLFKVGSRNEDPNRAGIAHFTEHIVFDGTRKVYPSDKSTRDWPNVVMMESEIINRINVKWESYNLGAPIQSPSSNLKSLQFGDNAVIKLKPS